MSSLRIVNRIVNLFVVCSSYGDFKLFRYSNFGLTIICIKLLNFPCLGGGWKEHFYYPFSTLQYSSVQCSAVQYSIPKCSTVQSIVVLTKGIKIAFTE